MLSSAHGFHRESVGGCLRRANSYVGVSQRSVPQTHYLLDEAIERNHCQRYVYTNTPQFLLRKLPSNSNDKLNYGAQSGASSPWKIAQVIFAGSRGTATICFFRLEIIILSRSTASFFACAHWEVHDDVAHARTAVMRFALITPR